MIAARIGFGACLFFCYAIRSPDAAAIYGPHGLPGPDLFQSLQTAPGIVQALARWTQPVAPTLPNPVFVGLYGLLLASSLCFAVGFRTRTAGTIALLLHAYMLYGRNPTAYWGWGMHIIPLLVYAIAAPSGRFLSVDSWLDRRRSGAPPAAPSEWVAAAWPLRLLQIHTAALYFSVGWSRIDNLGWQRGHMVFAAVTDLKFTRFAIDWQPFKPILTIFSYATFVLEPLAPFLLWLRRIGPVWAYALIVMHLGVELMTDVGYWQYVLAVSLLAFIPVRHLEAALRRLPGA